MTQEERDRRNAYAREYRRRNPEKMRESYERRKEKIREYRRKNADRFREYFREYRRECMQDPDVRAKINEQRKICRRRRLERDPEYRKKIHENLEKFKLSPSYRKRKPYVRKIGTDYEYKTPEWERDKNKAYYWAHRDEILAKNKAKRDGKAD